MEAPADPAAPPAFSVADTIGFDMKLIFVTGAVGLYAAIALLKDIYYVVWRENDTTTTEVRKVSNDTLDNKMAICETYDEGNASEHKFNWQLESTTKWNT